MKCDKINVLIEKIKKGNLEELDIVLLVSNDNFYIGIIEDKNWKICLYFPVKIFIFYQGNQLKFQLIDFYSPFNIYYLQFSNFNFIGDLKKLNMEIYNLYIKILIEIVKKCIEKKE